MLNTTPYLRIGTVQRNLTRTQGLAMPSLVRDPGFELLLSQTRMSFLRTIRTDRIHLMTLGRISIQQNLKHLTVVNMRRRNLPLGDQLCRPVNRNCQYRFKITPLFRLNNGPFHSKKMTHPCLELSRQGPLGPGGSIPPTGRD